MSIGKEPQRNPNQANPKAQAWMDIATDPATDPQDFLTEDPADVQELIAGKEEPEGKLNQRSQDEINRSEY